MKIKFTPTKALLLLYVAQFLMATDCAGCNCHGITKSNVVYTGVEIVPWDTSKFRNKIVEGTASKNSFGVEIIVLHDFQEIAYRQNTNNNRLTAGFGFAYAWSCSCVTEYEYPDPISSININVTDVATQNEVDVTANFTKYDYENTQITVDELLKEYNEQQHHYLHWELDLTNTNDIPDTAVFTLVVMLESGITFTQQTDEINFLDE